MRLRDFIKDALSRLSALYPEREAGNIISVLCGERLGVKSWTHVVEPEYEIPAADLPGLLSDLDRLCEWEPIQYVLGVTEFCGLRFRVAPGVLIPRPETEQLVSLAADYLTARAGRARVLELCTGSGCIAWSLVHEFPGIEVTATDISPEALEIASGQFPSLPPGVRAPHFMISDLLSEAVPGEYDLIVSNPPYIRESERAAMRPNVLDNEPALALFVPDEDATVFYRAIAALSRKCLAPGGRVMVEINEDLAAETAGVFRAEGYGRIDTISDFCGKLRFLSIAL